MFFCELKQNVTRDFFKKYFHGEKRINKVFTSNASAIENFFNTCVSIFKINTEADTGCVL